MHKQTCIIDIFRNLLPADCIQGLWDASGFYPSFVAQPSDETGAQQGKHVRDAFTIQHLCVGHPVQPPNVQDAPKMEAVQPLLLACVCSPCFADVKKKAENTGVVDA